MPIHYGTNNVATSGSITSPSGNFINSLLLNGENVSTGPKKMLEVNTLDNPMLYEFQSSQLVYSNVVYDPYSSYSTLNGQYTVPSGQGGMYLVFMSFVAGQGSPWDSTYLSVNYGNNQTATFNNGGTYADVNGWSRYGGTIPILVSSGNTIHLDAYVTSDISPNNDYSYFNVFALYKL